MPNPQFDCLFVNGDSYSAADIHGITTYAEFLSQHFDVPLINKSAVGSSNDRIMRSTLESVINLVETGKTPLVILGLSFVRRREVWYYGSNIKKYQYFGNTQDILHWIPDSESNLSMITLDFLADTEAITPGQKAQLIDSVSVKHLHKILVDFYMNLFLFCNWIEKMNLQYYVFSAANNTYLECLQSDISGLRLADWCKKNPRIWSHNDFCFLDWAKVHDKDAKETGHLSTSGHKKLANVLIQNLKSLPGGLHETI